MKEILEKDLVIGEVYADRENKEEAIFLRYMGVDEVNDPLFEYVSGATIYSTGSKGYIGFKSCPKNTWYIND